jgi:hypothetical protein
MAFAAIACIPDNFVVGEGFILGGLRGLVLVLGRHNENDEKLVVCVRVESG